MKVISLALTALLFLQSGALAQMPSIRHGEVVPRDVREMYDRGVQYLASTQAADGGWSDGQSGPGVTGLGLMVFLASGEDPNYGKYSSNVRRCLRNIISDQNAATGYIGNSMYHHGFAMLGLSEAYGAVDERNLWPAGGQKKGRSIGEALELAVRLAITSQKKNPSDAWRYSPDTTSADTSVSGSVMVGLLAARNAGIEVPDPVFDKAIKYFTVMTSNTGSVGYSGIGGHGGESLARSSIACLVYAVARRKDLDKYDATVKYLSGRIEQTGSGHYEEYTRYYQAQALFQGDFESWTKWNKLLIRRLKATQQPDGSFQGQFGKSLGTTMNLLALALNYRFLPIYER